MLSIPSPSNGVWEVAGFPIRGYALCIIAGIAVAIWVTERRFQARGGQPGVVLDVAVWAVPFGIIGGRLYHVVTSPDAYFGAGGSPAAVVRVWEGGLGIWGAVLLGGVGAWIGVRRRGIPLPPFADALAPGLALAQAIGRWGNWFNQELFGSPTTVPWALEIDLQHRPTENLDAETFHPTFLYESLWLVAVAVFVVWADRRWRLGHGQVFALYVALYCAGRLPIELLRVDTATEIVGVRVNVWVSVAVAIGAVGYFVLSRRRFPQRETAEELQGHVPQPSSTGER